MQYPQKEHIYHLTVREAHLDSFGHVNNAEVMRILEEARWEMITENGYGLADVISEGRGPVILEANIRFKKELKLRDKLRIETRCTGYRGRIGFLAQRVLSGAGELSVEATFTLGLFDLQTRRLILPTEKWKHALSLSES